jgi:hypothetical protein
LNQDISDAPVDPNSATYIASIGAGTGLHPDFGFQYGYQLNLVPGTQPKVPISFGYAGESDPGPYPIPPNPLRELGGDAHCFVLDQDSCYLYEIFGLSNDAAPWTAASGAIWHLREDWTRPAGWTSADAAGLPIIPLLVRYDEVAAGEIRHAVRFTAQTTQHGYVFPASHYASSNTSPSVPPMGIRVRLKASVDISGFSPTLQVILRALQRYGMVLADNGGNWFITGMYDDNWNDDVLHAIGGIHGGDFEVIQTGPITTQ